ncbi:M1 family metallopeptidase [Amycolatopsis sp. H20-H5]|uniref:M1 family metallopeptidase n=1 Tax=Amycolatopsis sp. H20-H5 TaxID=3046309 RepID=UPI002DBE96EA|nr:M1 family metallopeptidase [Amycolatopsis sp. H20-H5]MEC3977932.1 M1 family metallopeptidase [Amycolatopsis sp. H20-H5]
MRGLNHWRRGAVTAVAVLAGISLGAGIALADPGFGGAKPGSDGAGDSYYPQDGNGGYDVADYDLKVDYAPATHQLTGSQTISARATQSLSSFDLDLSGPTVDSVKVDGRDAKFTRTGDHELVITPARPVWRGERFTTKIAYHGVPAAIDDPLLGLNGWQYGKSGGAFAAGEPRSATTWYPVNDTPLDKATFHLAITVPDEWGVIGNGREGRTFKTPKGTTHVWDETTPAVPYMTTVAIDKWEFDRTKLSDGTPVVSAYAPGTSDETKAAERRLPEIIDFLSSKFGPYPVDAAGGIFLAEPIGFSLETLSRPIYSGRAGDLQTIVHENAHQWYGDTVAVENWKDVCLNECFASYAQWLWSEAKEGQDLNARYLAAVKKASPAFWAGKLYDMGPGNEFTYVYSKGPLALHALRNTIGQQAFDKVIKTWNRLNHDGNASMPEFQRYTERVAHMNLQGFFDAWIYGNAKPSDQYLYPGSLKPSA